MNRRAFTRILAGAAVLPWAQARAQQPGRVPRIAVLEWERPEPEAAEAMRAELRGLGHVEGRSIAIEYFYAEGRMDRARTLAAEIAARPVDVIVAFTTPAAHAVKDATAKIPIVVSSADPLGTGLVDNLARPGGNLTGASNMMTEQEPKRMELLREMLPGAGPIGYLGSAPDPATPRFVREASDAAAQAGLRLESVLIDDRKGIDDAFARMARDGIGAVVVQPLFALNPRGAAEVAESAARHRMPTITSYAFFPKAGGLASFGPEPYFARRRMAVYVDRILKGAKPGDLPVEQPSKFELVINLKTARALGLSIPEAVLARADELVE